MKLRDGEQAQWFRTLAAHPEDSSRLDSQHSQMFITLSSKGSDVFSCLYRQYPCAV